MSTIQITVKPRDIDIAKFIAGGYDPSTTTVSVDLSKFTEPQRLALSEVVERDGGKLVIHQPYTGKQITLEEPTEEGLIRAVMAAREAAERNAALVAQQAAEAAARLEAARAKTDRELLEVLRNRETDAFGRPRLLPGSVYPYGYGNGSSPVGETPDWKEWVAELDAALEARKAENAAKAAAEQAAGLAALKEWAQQSGSERVQLLLEEGMDAWTKVAEAEFLSAHTPEGFAELDAAYTDKERTYPTVEDIKALREARKLEGGAVSDAELCWTVTYRKATEDEWELADSDGDVPVKFPAVRLTITAPTGKSIEVHKRINE